MDALHTWLQVAMHNIKAMDVLHALGHLLYCAQTGTLQNPKKYNIKLKIELNSG